MEGYKQFEYIKDEMKDLFAMADVVISRAGANAICEILALKKPNILIPLPSKSSRGDQLLNAKSFEESGYSVVLEQEKLNPSVLYKTVNKVYEKREKYIASMASAVQQDSIKAIMNLIENVSETT